MIVDTTASLIVGTLILTLPYFWEASDDRLGDFNKRRDVWIRGVLTLCVSLVNTILNARNWVVCLATSLNLSVAWFFMFFDYTIAWILIRNKIVEGRGVSWFDYLGKVGRVDNWTPWRGLSQAKHFWIRVAYLAAAVILYALFR